MNEVQTSMYRAPSRKGILAGTAVAFVTGVLLLITVILPVEYEIDLIGAGSALGLTAISAANASNTGTPLELPVPADPPASDDAGQYARNTDTPFRNETIGIPMQGDEELEYKIQMRKGDMLMYSWSSGDTEMYFEFHAEPTEGDFPEGYYMSYLIGDGSTGGHGTLTAPFTGRHGWYFLNLSEHPVTVKLEVSGYYGAHGRLENGVIIPDTVSSAP